MTKYGPHEVAVHGYGFLFYWVCECGRSGRPTTNGRARAAGERHALQANRRWRRARDWPES